MVFRVFGFWTSGFPSLNCLFVLRLTLFGIKYSCLSWVLKHSSYFCPIKHGDLTTLLGTYLFYYFILICQFISKIFIFKYLKTSMCLIYHYSLLLFYFMILFNDVHINTFVRHCPKSLQLWIHLILLIALYFSYYFFPTLYMREMRHREIKTIAQVTQQKLVQLQLDMQEPRADYPQMYSNGIFLSFWIKKLLG